MKDASLLRYSRQIMLPEFDIAGQQRLNEARVLVVGMGGLGCPAAMYLAAAGVGSLIIVDDDTVELTNLQRQIAHTERDLGQSKVESAKNTLAALNPEVDVLAINERVDAGRLCELAEQVDVVVDACDNFTTRFAVNAAAIQAGKPLVSGAAIRMEGQVAVFDSRNPASPCYQCLYRPGGSDDSSCSANGVMAPVVGVIGSLQALETIKVIASYGEPLVGRLLIFDGLTMSWREVKLPRDTNCAACCHRPA